MVETLIATAPLTRKEAARYLSRRWFPISWTTLATLAARGQRGPRYQTQGRRAIYRAEDLDAWARSQLRDPPDKPKPGGALAGLASLRS